MADPSALVVAAMGLLVAHPRLSNIVFDGNHLLPAHSVVSLDDRDPPWVQTSSDPGTWDSTAWAQSSDYVDMVFTTICVGGSQRASRDVANWVVQALKYVTPDVDGWKCHPIVPGAGRGTQEDHDLASLWTTVPTWRIRAYEKVPA